MSFAKTLALVASMLVAVAVNTAAAQTKRPHNVILFVPDGLRALSVTPDSAPAMAAVRDQGVNFRNSHSVFPTFTTANAAAMATGTISETMVIGATRSMSAVPWRPLTTA